MFQLGDNVFADVLMANWNRAYVTISGTGDMWKDASQFVNLNGTTKWSKIQGICSGTLTIPDGITSIANNFMNAKDFIGDLHTVNIGKDIVNIGDYAFGSINLQSLTTINISPDAKIETLGDYCFSSLKNLTTIDFNGTVTSIGEGCFYNCNKIKTLNLAKKLGTIKKNTFCGCFLLESFNYKNCVYDLSPDAFTNRAFYCCNNLTEITFQYGVAFPVTGGTEFMYVNKNDGVDCDAEGNLKTLIWTNNPQVSERDWLGLDNRNVTIKRIPSTLAIKHQSKIYDLHYFDQV